MKEKFMKAKH